ncbi:MAG: NUDIX hydrolase [Pseudohongiellaceae bacterium]|uniref:NUDIX hydrolase n=1 Tax=OM182 bacterium MED-G28 TaxID=1986256 RepID=A0A2A5W7E6_9GAMM|nr:MAG: NUDIX hydrolase [OM182 bacterium MED-G28]
MSDIEPVPAATVVLVRQSEDVPELEVLLLQRNSRLVFHGGHWVFPGGRIDAKDYQDSAPGLEYPAALRAAVRETKEEAGIDIDADQLIHTAHWTTPPNLPRRFCTWFFICPIFEMVSVSVDNDEILDHRWISPKAAIADEKAKRWVVPRPTLTTLSDIVDHKNLAELVAAVTASNIRVFPKASRYYRPAEMGCPD